MLRDARTRRLATEFACQWLHICDFDQLDEKSERHFPTFVGLRGAMYEESIQFFTDLFQNNGSVLNILDADHTFLNEALAKHYGIPGVSGARLAAGRRREASTRGAGSWPGDDARQAIRRFANQPDPARQLDQRSAARREAAASAEGRAAAAGRRSRTDGLTVRQLVEQHTQRPEVYEVCHQRIDPFGFALEASTRSAAVARRTCGDRADQLASRRWTERSSTASTACATIC